MCVCDRDIFVCFWGLGTLEFYRVSFLVIIPLAGSFLQEQMLQLTGKLSVINALAHILSQSGNGMKPGHC